MNTEPKQRWLSFTGSDIKKLLVKLTIKRVGFADALNVDTATLWRWENGLAPPSASSIPLLFILLWSHKVIETSPNPPRWWPKEKGKLERYRSTRFPCSPNVPNLKKARSPTGFCVAASARGISEMECLGKMISEAMTALSEMERPPKPSVRKVSKYAPLRQGASIFRKEPL